MRARSNTLGVPHQIYAVDSLALAEVAEAAVGGSRAPRQVPDFCVPSGLIEPARSRLSYAYTERVVSDPVQLFVVASRSQAHQKMRAVEKKNSADMLVAT